MFHQKLTRIYSLLWLLAPLITGCMNEPEAPVNLRELAHTYYGSDDQWYLDNIPFLECSDKELEQVYYYRWKMYKAHIRETGPDQFVITEFINHVGWDRDPYCTINAASMHHIYEGRWLKDNRYLDGYIDYLFQKGGNDRRYSESVADAAYARFLVNGDSAFIVKQLDDMIRVYQDWKDHWDSTKNLYYIPAMPDATEYTIASIDASGGKDGFDDGEAFRPTINSYMYGNAVAISRIAKLKGDEIGSKRFRAIADSLRERVNIDLWNDTLHHYTDRFKVDNQYVHYWDFIRGRELAGMIPWYFDLPPDQPKYNAAWKHVLDTSYLLGPYGLRTNEPGYPYYFKQFVYFEGKRGSQWNGPSWPYQTSQTLTGMANFLNDYEQEDVTNSDYLKLLRLYTRQHFLPDGKVNLVEDYDPNNGGPIVFYYWSNHYNHSSYNNLIISGLCGIRPSDSDTLQIHPLIDSSIKYFYLDDVRYHGHTLRIVYDQTGEHYHLGKGLLAYVDGKKKAQSEKKLNLKTFIGSVVNEKSIPEPENLALNIAHIGYPLPSGSVNANPDTSLYQAIDGRIWYFPEITNRWTTRGSSSIRDWFSIDFGHPIQLDAVRIYLIADEKEFFLPDSLQIEFRNNDKWVPVTPRDKKPVVLTGNTVNQIDFKKLSTRQIRIVFIHRKGPVALTEIKCIESEGN